MREDWLLGLASNLAAPAELLLRLLQPDTSAVWPVLVGARDLPQPVVDAILAHPERRVLRMFATNPVINPAQRARRLENPKAYLWLALCRACPPLPDSVISAVLDRDDHPLMTRQEVLSDMIEAEGGRVWKLAARHPRARVRALSVGGWPHFGLDVREALTNDPDPAVREALADHLTYLDREIQPDELPPKGSHSWWLKLGDRRLARDIIAKVLADGDDSDLWTLARNKYLPADVIAKLLKDCSPEIRVELAARHDLTDGQLEQLAADPDRSVRTAVSVHPRLTERRRAELDIEVSVDGDFCWRPQGQWLMEPQVSRRDATSVNPLLRRNAARDSQLPTDLVHRLAEDIDLGVRVLLSLHHSETPSDTVLRSYLEYAGKDRDRLLLMPNFPDHDLDRFASHRDPKVRMLIGRDMTADPAVVEQLLDDPEQAVRQAMAASPRLSLDRIEQLLDNPELARWAASNPALPVTTMWRLFDAEGTI